MTERKIEALVHDVLIATESLEKNLQSYRETQVGFSRLYDEMMLFVSLVEKIGKSQEKIKKQEAEKFSKEIAAQVRRYQEALQSVNIDTTQIEAQLDRTHRSIHGMVEKIDSSAALIAKTVDENGQAVIAAAEKIKQRKGDLLWRTVFLGMGMIVGGLFLAAYPIAFAAEHFHDELLLRDKQIQQLKEQYETNSKTLAFLKDHDITIRHTMTDDSWENEGLSHNPLILIDKKRVKHIDRIKEYQRIIFSKSKNRSQR